MKNANKTISYTLILLIAILLTLIGNHFVNVNFRQIGTDDVTQKENTFQKVYRASLIATGDALLHPPVYKAGYSISTNSYDYSDVLAFTKEKISNYDIKYYNQETVFDDDKNYSGYPVFNSPSSWGQNMIDTGFNTVSLATNHSMDMGTNSAKKSASWWESKDGVLATGMASSEERRNDYKIMEVNGITYTMLSYTYGTNGILVTEDYTVNLFNEEAALKDIKAVRDKVDVLIVAMHWGTEYNLDATSTQRAQAKFLADNGVDIVLGTHSHCIEPWERIGNTIVFYSFGNFISNQMMANTPSVRKVGVIGMFGTLDITKTIEKNGESTITIDNVGADLTYTRRFYNNVKKIYDYQVIPFSKINSEYLSNYQGIYREFSSVLKKYDDSINIEPLPLN